MAQPNRDLVLHPRAQTPSPWRLRFQARPACQNRAVHRLLQRNNGNAIPLDLCRKTSGRWSHKMSPSLPLSCTSSRARALTCCCRSARVELAWRAAVGALLRLGFVVLPCCVLAGLRVIVRRRLTEPSHGPTTIHYHIIRSVVHHSKIRCRLAAMGQNPNASLGVATSGSSGCRHGPREQSVGQAVPFCFRPSIIGLEVRFGSRTESNGLTECRYARATDRERRGRGRAA